MIKNSIDKVRALLQRPGLRYVIVGGSVYVLEVLIILIAQHNGATATMAVGISFWVGLIVSFILQKMITFSDRRMRHAILVPQVVAFALLVTVNFFFTLLLVKLLSSLVPAFVGRTVALGITTLWNFFIYRTQVFKTATVDAPYISTSQER